MKKIIGLVLVMMMSVAALTACGTGSDSGTESSSGGSVSTDGSTSMEKVIGALGEAFEQDNPDTTFTYNPTGSGSGITAVSEGRCDIGLSSRSLEDHSRFYSTINLLICLKTQRKPCS